MDDASASLVDKASDANTGNREAPIEVLENTSVPSSFSEKRLKPRKPRARPIEWSPEMTTTLLRELVQAIRMGKKSDNGFKREVWNSVAESVQKVTSASVPVTGEKCQGKLEMLKRKWKIWTRLRGMSGFGFDVITSAVTAPDDVWDMEIRKDPAIQEFRDKPMANTAELAEILDGSQATGCRAIYPSIPRSISTELDSQTEDDTPLSDHTAVDTSSHQSKKRKASDGESVKQLGRIRPRAETATERLLQAVETMASTSLPSIPNSSVVHQAVTKFREAYRGKPGWSTEDMLVGYELFESQIKAEVFLALGGGEEEEQWLRRQISYHKG